MASDRRKQLMALAQDAKTAGNRDAWNIVRADLWKEFNVDIGSMGEARGGSIKKKKSANRYARGGKAYTNSPRMAKV